MQLKQRTHAFGLKQNRQGLLENTEGLFSYSGNTGTILYFSTIFSSKNYSRYYKLIKHTKKIFHLFFFILLEGRTIRHFIFFFEPALKNPNRKYTHAHEQFLDLFLINTQKVGKLEKNLSVGIYSLKTRVTPSKGVFMPSSFFPLLTSKLLPLLYTIFGFGALVTVHELGHFLFCKLFNIHTPTFSIGFGPEIIKKKIGSTNFRLALLPLGGYVEIAGHAEVGQGDQEFSHHEGTDSFSQKPYWQKFLVLSGGIIFNLLFSYFIFTALFLVGAESNNPGLLVTGVTTQSAADKGGLLPKDLIVEINTIKLIDNQNNLIENADTLFLEETRKNPNQTISLTVMRDNSKKEFSITLGSRMEQGKAVGALGVALGMPYQKASFSQALKKGFYETIKWIKLIGQSISKLISSGSLDGAGGPLLILANSFTSVQVGFIPFFIFLAIISINLALINLLPLGIVDGGQLLFVTIEAIIRRKIPDSIKLGINLTSFVLFIALFLFLTYKDVASLFGERIYQFYLMIKSKFF